MEPICTFDQLLAAITSFEPLAVAVVGATDPSVLQGVVEATELGIIRPTLVGPEATVRARCEEAPGAGAFPVIDAATEDEAAAVGVALVHDASVEGLVKGHVHTATFMSPVIKQLRTKQRVSHVFLVELATYPKLLAITDAAVNILPDLRAKADIVENAVELARRLGIDRPKVAALSAVELVNPSIPSTIDAACLSKMSDRGQIHHAIVDGPLAFDVAISAESARTKGIDSPVSGDVDILLAPDLDAGNILVKDLEYLAAATIAGIVLGASAPIILTSRSDPPRSRLLSCAVASYLARTIPR